MTRTFIASFVVALVFSACAAPQITSDVIMFPKHRADSTKTGRGYHTFRHSAAFETKPSIAKIRAFDEEVNNQSTESTTYSPEGYSARNFGFYKYHFTNADFSLGVGIQPPVTGVPSIDVTALIRNDLYLSAGLHPVGVQTVLQRRLYWTGNRGAAVGIFYQTGIFVTGKRTIVDRESGQPGEVAYSIGSVVNYFRDAAGVRYRWFYRHPGAVYGKKERGFSISAGVSQGFSTPFFSNGV